MLRSAPSASTQTARAIHRSLSRSPVPATSSKALAPKLLPSITASLSEHSSAVPSHQELKWTSTNSQPWLGSTFRWWQSDLGGTEASRVPTETPAGIGCCSEGGRSSLGWTWTCNAMSWGFYKPPNQPHTKHLLDSWSHSLWLRGGQRAHICPLEKKWLKSVMYVVTTQTTRAKAKAPGTSGKQLSCLQTTGWEESFSPPQVPQAGSAHLLLTGVHPTHSYCRVQPPTALSRQHTHSPQDSPSPKALLPKSQPNNRAVRAPCIIQKQRDW